jgi:membrane-associated protein
MTAREMIKTIIDFILHIDTHLLSLIQTYGNYVYIFLFLIIFMETGLVLTPFLPGDSLLFIAGTLAAAGALNVILLFLILAAAAILGDTANYWLGKFFGEKFFSRFIKHEHMERTRKFFERYGKKTIVLARFVPIIRTFAPFVAGIGKMNYFTFVSYNVIGGIAWVALFVFAGYFFGNIPFVKDNLKFIVVLIIIISLIPMLLEYIKHKKEKAGLTKGIP